MATLRHVKGARRSRMGWGVFGGIAGTMGGVFLLSKLPIPEKWYDSNARTIAFLAGSMLFGGYVGTKLGRFFASDPTYYGMETINNLPTNYHRNRTSVEGDFRFFLTMNRNEYRQQVIRARDHLTNALRQKLEQRGTAKLRAFLQHFRYVYVNGKGELVGTNRPFFHSKLFLIPVDKIL